MWLCQRQFAFTDYEMTKNIMKRVTGIGVIFFKTQDPEKLKAWYQEHLGLEPDSEGEAVVFKWRETEQPEAIGRTVWSPFPADTKYFAPSQSSFMINYRVVDLDRLLDQLRSEGVEVDERIEEYEYGRFAWIMDREGNRIELWEPPEAK
jgi:predicted enzyme related to lactoylglutathione lyase